MLPQFHKVNNHASFQEEMKFDLALEMFIIQ
jgi:hypothetical protein